MYKKLLFLVSEHWDAGIPYLCAVHRWIRTFSQLLLVKIIEKDSFLATMTTTPNGVDDSNLNIAMTNEQNLTFNSAKVFMLGIDHDIKTIVSDLSELTWDGKEKKGSNSTDQSDDSSNKLNNEADAKLTAQFQQVKATKEDLEEQLKIESCRLNHLLAEFDAGVSSNLVREEIKYQNTKVRDTQKDLLVCETTFRQIAFRLNFTSRGYMG